MNELNKQHRDFCHYYVELNGNATEAARRAGYKENSARQQGSRLLTKDHITQYIKKLMEPSDKKRKASADDVIEYLTKVMFGEERDQFDLDPALNDRNKAAELLGKYHKLFVDRKEIDASVTSVIIQDDI